MKKEYELKKMKRRAKVKVDKTAAKVPISLRLDSEVLVSLKDEAERKGLPYQTLISSILFQYVNGEFVEKKLQEILKDHLAS
jgi:predicted DNA binding CopG/RHH family protein